MADHHEEEQLGKLYDGRAARRLIRYLGPYKRTVAVALVLTVGLNLARQAGPLLTKWAIDDYVKPASEGAMGLDHAFHGISILSLVYILSLAVTLGVGYFQDVLLNTIGQRVMYDLREQIFGKLQSIEVAFYDTNPVGRLITRLTTDVDALNELFTSGLVEVLGDVDAAKFRSCLTLFAQIAGERSLFSEALNMYFQGQPDRKTLSLPSAGTGQP